MEWMLENKASSQDIAHTEEESGENTNQLVAARRAAGKTEKKFYNSRILD
jgi:hypothetical protein